MTANELKEIRKRVFGLTQREFGKLIGKSLFTIQRWESGRAPIPEAMEKYINLLIEKELERKNKIYGFKSESS